MCARALRGRSRQQLTELNGISNACQPIGLENGANPPAEWFPRSQGPGLRPPNSEVDGSERNFRVNLHCKYGRPSLRSSCYQKEDEDEDLSRKEGVWWDVASGNFLGQAGKHLEEGGREGEGGGWDSQSIRKATEKPSFAKGSGKIAERRRGPLQLAGSREEDSLWRGAESPRRCKTAVPAKSMRSLPAVAFLQHGALLELSQREGDPAMEKKCFVLFFAKADEKQREGDGWAFWKQHRKDVGDGIVAL
ncbi:hypothetical protein L345_05381, partial [Ophiophagus hannah]